jgi:hypothetical protein
VPLNVAVSGVCANPYGSAAKRIIDKRTEDLSIELPELNFVLRSKGARRAAVALCIANAGAELLPEVVASNAGFKTAPAWQPGPFSVLLSVLRH